MDSGLWILVSGFRGFQIGPAQIKHPVHCRPPWILDSRFLFPVSGFGPDMSGLDLLKLSLRALSPTMDSGFRIPVSGFLVWFPDLTCSNYASRALSPTMDAGFLIPVSGFRFWLLDWTCSN